MNFVSKCVDIRSGQKPRRSESKNHNLPGASDHDSIIQSRLVGLFRPVSDTIKSMVSMVTMRTLAKAEILVQI
jgi:hypothetical protein